MRIGAQYSHLNGLEFLIVHRSELIDEIYDVIRLVNAQDCLTKVFKERTKKGELLYSPKDMNAAFKKYLKERDWKESRVDYWVTKDE